MAFMVDDKGADREKPPVGTHAGILIATPDIGWQPGFQGSQEKKVLYLYEIDVRLAGGPHAGKRHLVSERMKQTMNEKSNLYKRISGMKGTSPVAPYDVEQDIGLPVLVSLVESKDKKYINIGSVVPCPKQMVIQRETPVGYLPEWVVKLIAEGKNGPPVEGQGNGQEWHPDMEDQPPAENPVAGQEDPLEANSAPPPAPPAPLTPLGESRKRANEMLTVLHPLISGMQYKELWDEKEKAWGDKPSLDFLVDVKWKSILDRIGEKK